MPPVSTACFQIKAAVNPFAAHTLFEFVSVKNLLFILFSMKTLKNRCLKGLFENSIRQDYYSTQFSATQEERGDVTNTVSA